MSDTDKPTDEMIEAAARAMFNTGTGDYSWEQMLHEDQARAEIWREDARVVLVAALEASRTPAPAGRLDPEFRADLVEAAKDRIQAVWDDVPAGVDAATLASNVVMAQEFFWLSRQFPVVPVTPAEGEAEDREALDSAISHNLSPIFGWSQLGHELATPERWRERVQKAIDDILAAGFSRRSPVETEENWEYRALAHFKDGQVADLVEFKSREAALTYAMKSNETEPRPNIVDGDDIEVMWIAEERKVFSTRPNPWLPVTEEKK